ncbi:MAG: TonB-dependent receptor [Gammaproteobacteria bacterium]|nr:TonB-dependent receptor [Gammaproteobacteria bacterium]
MFMMAQQVPANSGDEPLEQIVVTARKRAVQDGMLAEKVQQTEVVELDAIRSAQAAVLSDALVATPGVRVNNECSMCGVKRVMLNGLGGQHTTLLVDGLPAHTLMSGFYGPDALSLAGVERIEVARGAGASLTAPEAIGGIINVITQEPARTGLSLNAAGGDNGFQQADLIGSLVNGAGTASALLAGQFDSRDQFDGDGNGVSENPFLENRNIAARLSFDLTPESTLSLRAAYTDSEIFGGPVIGDTTSSIRSALASFADGEADALFEGDDVRNRFVGNPWETTEWIETTRQELSARYFQQFAAAVNLDAGVSWAGHEQDSFYEGFDYRADNDMLYATARLNWVLNDAHLLTFGADRRDEELRSDSDAAANDPAFISDSFDYLTLGIFVQDTWTPNDRLEVALAARLDTIDADFFDPQRPGTEIEETLVSPRFDARYRHNDRWTSRLSAGQGYRAPLSFFETDHGILDAGLGFVIDVDELERSLSATYALSYTGDRLNWTGGLAWTSVDNLAALDETEDGVPLLTQRDDTIEVYGLTFDLGYVLTDDLDLTLTAETFERDAVMRSSFGVAPVEERIVTGIEWHPGPWDIDLTAVWIGSRDLARYGYEGFNDAAATDRKPTDVSSFVTVDARIEFTFSDRLAFYAGGRNLFDETQVRDDSPLFFDAGGGYDVAYIYGALRGRELYAGLRAEF